MADTHSYLKPISLWPDEPTMATPAATWDQLTRLAGYVSDDTWLTVEAGIAISLFFTVIVIGLWAFLRPATRHSSLPQ